jgi:uncharacterized protein YcbX
MAHLARIHVYPIKSLDPTERDCAAIVENGGLTGDREYAMVDADGDYVNGKRTAAVHRIRADFDGRLVTVGRTGDPERRSFHLDDDRDALEAWLSAQVDPEVSLVREERGGFPDDTTLSGPTVIATATIEEVASWFDGIDADEMRLRLRPNLEIGGVEPFWEDRLYAADDRCVAFEIGDVTLLGANPCQRCVVPSRNPSTGEETDGFTTTFVERREETLPEFAERSRFDHYFRLMVNTAVERSEWGNELAVGDDIEVLGERPLPE